MNPTIQSGTHPDAETLTAFAEQLLSGGERERILAHMAVCGRCRGVVFLAQKATDAEEPAQVLVQRDVQEKAGRGWFAGWRWAWVPVAALAGFVGLAVVQHMRHAAPEQQMARSQLQTEVINGGLATKTVNGPATQKAPKRDESKALSAVRQNAATLKEETASKDEHAAALDQKKAAEKDEAKQVADAMMATAGVAGGAMGTPVARAKSSAVGGPMAQNQMQQQNYAAQQNSLVQAQSAANEMANKPLAPAVPAPAARPDAVSESVEVRPAQQAASVSAERAPAREMTMVPVTGQSLDDSRDKTSKQKGARVMLPSGIEALSVATAAERTIAIDTAGALFVSADGGRHWQPVKTQWTGRAVLVRTRQMTTESGMLSKEQTPQFELVNDKLQTWVSVDGKTWTEQTLPGK